MNYSLSPFAPENLVSRDGFGSPISRQPAHLPVVVASPQAPPAGDPVQPAVGEACGRAIKNTSGVRKYVRELSASELKEDGMNVRCVVKKKWPRSGLTPERVTT